MSSAIPTLYRGSVKDVLGPVKVGPASGVVFEYTDAYSVFDWGRMPDPLQHKGEALATLAADFFERLERPDCWRDFSKSAQALGLRKGNRFGAAFNELGEELQGHGLRTHYLGVIPSLTQRVQGEVDLQPRLLSQVQGPVKHVAVKQVSVVKPAMVSVLGRMLPDYVATRGAPAPRLIPLEVVFRFSCPPGSSLLERMAKDPQYLASLGFADLPVSSGGTWEFPVIELFTKLESTDRPVPLSEALAISGLSGAQLQELLFKTAWVAGYLRWNCAMHGLELADGKVEWGLTPSGECILVDAIGPDELRILKSGTQLSKEFLRTFYRSTPWYQAIRKAKEQASTQGVSDWKRLVTEAPPVLPGSHRELASQVYLSLTNSLSERNWFPQAWSLDRLVSELKKV